MNVSNPSLTHEGIVMVPCSHHGCSQKSVEEGAIIQSLYNSLIGSNFEDGQESRRISTEDILVVTPYNVQVNYLSSLLPEGAKVGTVDKFQGQEAAIVLVSMVSSSSEDLSRQMDFLFSKNRLNVAISRAQCLAVVVMNDRLLDSPCPSIATMTMVNTFCYLKSISTKIQPATVS